MTNDLRTTASEPAQQSRRLFDIPEEESAGTPNREVEALAARPRYQRAERNQVEMRFFALDEMLPADHMARIVWQYVSSLDLSRLYEGIRAVEGVAGRNPVDPKILMTLWLFATIEGIGSARRLAKLSERDLAYMWICGGVGVNHDLLNDFRAAHPEVFEQALIDNIAALLHQDLISLKRVAQDGMRVRAHAGTSSMRRRSTLEKCREEARQHLEEIRKENESNPNAYDARTKSARERAARERAERIDQALEEVTQLAEQKEKREKGSGETARASTTDPEARTMKMADGGYRPAFNVQFVTTGGSRLIVGVDVTNSGSDNGQMGPMAKKIETDYGVIPEQYLVDGSYTGNSNDITQLEHNGTEVIGPIRNEERQKAKGIDPFARKRDDTDAVFQWRSRMNTEEAKTIYKERASTAEFPNAVCRNRGLYQFRVRGTVKAKAVALLHALAYNLTRMINMNVLHRIT